MITITKERLLTIKQWRETYGPGSNVVLPAEEAEELARIALASLEAEPIGEVSEKRLGLVMDGTVDLGGKSTYRIIKGEKAMKLLPLGTKFYTAPPVPVVPEEKPMPNPIKMYAVDAVAAIAEVRGWNACRAAMLQSQGNCIKDGWISCSERMPNDKQYVWCWGKSYGWTECDTFEGYYDWSRNKWWAVTDDGEEPASKVTHWMLLPEPPLEVNRG